MFTNDIVSFEQPGPVVNELQSDKINRVACVPSKDSDCFAQTCQLTPTNREVFWEAFTLSVPLLSKLPNLPILKASSYSLLEF